MPKKPPPVSLRKPPAAVDLDRAEAFVRKPEEPKDVKATERLSVKTPERPSAKASERSDVRKVEAPAPAPEAPPPQKGASKSVVARHDGRTLRRMTLYLPDDLARKLAVYCARKDREMSAAVTEAVRLHLAAEPDE